jgi:hypothetical protein
VTAYDLSVPRPPTIDPEQPDVAPSAPLWPWLAAGLATLIAGALYAVGWLAGSALVPILDAGRWMMAAMATGWDDAATSWRRTGRMGE